MNIVDSALLGEGMEFANTLAAAEVGSYISVWKSLAALVIIMIWARLLTWMDKDAVDAHLPRVGINAGMIVTLIGATFLFLILPGFGVAIAVLLVLFGLSIGAYLGIRNQKVGLKDVGDELKAFFAAPFDKIKKEKKIEAGPGDVVLFNHKG